MTSKHNLVGKMVSAVLGFGVLALSSSAVCAFQDITPTEAYGWATADENVFILDVRTEAEWRWVGHPGQNKLPADLGGPEGAELNGKVVNISYLIDQKGQLINNKHFVKDVDDLFESNPGVVLITMCRSGSRSISAAEALEAAGYLNVYNMATGFEGGKDERGYRTVNGWKADGLPYTYSGQGYIKHTFGPGYSWKK